MWGRHVASPVQLVEVDVIRLQSPQARLAGRPDALTVEPAIFGLRVAGHHAVTRDVVLGAVTTHLEHEEGD